jgi:uncharacterized protein
LITTKSGKYSDPIRIRAHHLLCMQGFQGYGYSSDFVANMRQIISFLKLNPYHYLEIVVNTDELCSQCPYNVVGRCEKGSHDEINNIDRLVIENADLNLKHIYTVNEAFKTINENLNYHHIVSICSECKWKNKCLFFIQKTKI